jgi:hypothetical protein
MRQVLRVGLSWACYLAAGMGKAPLLRHDTAHCNGWPRGLAQAIADNAEEMGL